MLSTLVWSQIQNTSPHQLLWRRLTLSQPKQVHYHYLDHTDMPSDSLVSQINTYLLKRQKIPEDTELLHDAILLEIQNELLVKCSFTVHFWKDSEMKTFCHGKKYTNMRSVQFFPIYLINYHKLLSLAKLQHYKGLEKCVGCSCSCSKRHSRNKKFCCSSHYTLILLLFLANSTIWT